MRRHLQRGTFLVAPKTSAEWRSPLIRTAVLTGGNGYVGSSLIRRLQQADVEIHAFVNENHQRLDTLLPSSYVHVLKQGVDGAAEMVTRIQPDVIFHLAAVYAEPTSVPSIRSMIDGNLTLGATMLHAATRCAVPPAFVNTGTYWQFANDQTYSPNTLYAATKQAFQDILTYYCIHQRVPSTTLVLYDVFGPGDDRPKLWNRITRCPPATHVPLSQGIQQIQLVHIDDVVEAFVIAADRLCAGLETGPLYAVRSTETRTLRELLDAFNSRSGLDLSYGWGEIPTWHGVVQVPWLGEILPTWRTQREVITELLKMATQSQLHERGQNIA